MSKKKGLVRKAIGFDTLKEGFTLTTDMVKSIKPSKEEYIEETFEEALDRLGIKAENKIDHLLKIYGQLRVRFLIYLFAQLLLLGWGIYNFAMYSNITTFISTIVIFLLLTVFNLSNSLRCYQIRVMKLGNIKEWSSNYREWFPKKITKDYWSNK